MQQLLLQQKKQLTLRSQNDENRVGRAYHPASRAAAGGLACAIAVAGAAGVPLRGTPAAH